MGRVNGNSVSIILLVIVSQPPHCEYFRPNNSLLGEGEELGKSMCYVFLDV